MRSPELAAQVSFSSEEEANEDVAKAAPDYFPYIGQHPDTGAMYVCDPDLNAMVALPKRCKEWSLIREDAATVRLEAINSDIKHRYVHDLMTCSKATPLQLESNVQSPSPVLYKDLQAQ